MAASVWPAGDPQKLPGKVDSAYVHGTRRTEQARLAALNRLANRGFLEYLKPARGLRVMDVGSGLGLLASEVAAVTRRPVLALERAERQVAACVREGLLLIQGDAHLLPVLTDSVDLVYCRFVLEHVPSPGQVLAEMHRVLRPGGTVAVCENDTSLLRLDPPCPAFERAWEAFVRYQAHLGGDSFIGRRLFRLLRDAGFQGIELSVQPELHWHGSPDFDTWLANLAGNLASARHAIEDGGFAPPGIIAEGMEAVRALSEVPSASATFVWNRARAIKQLHGTL